MGESVKEEVLGGGIEMAWTGSGKGADFGGELDCCSGLRGDGFTGLKAGGSNTTAAFEELFTRGRKGAPDVGGAARICAISGRSNDVTGSRKICKGGG